MNNTIVKKSILPGLILTFCISNIIIGQATISTRINSPIDSLSLKNVILQVITTYPSVKEAEEAVRNAESRIELAKTGYNPVLDMTASYANLGPVTKLSFPGLGTFQLYPGNNYSASVNYQQLVYDFGRTHQNIELENGNKAISEQTLEQVKQRLSLYVVNSFYTILYLQAAIKIKDEQLATLNEHLQYVEKTLSTGSATEYQVLTTKVRISATESQKVDLVAALKAQQAALNSLLGNDQTGNPVVRNEISAEPPAIPSDSVLAYAYHNRDEIRINEKKTSLAELKYGMTKLQNKPFLNFQASAGAKNGYLPNLNKFTPNYVIGLGFRIPIFDGMKNKYNLAQAQSAINSMSYESELTKRSISNEVVESEALMSAAAKKVSQSDLQLQQALTAYSLAETSFRSGTITNLDLLDANTSVSESSLLLLKARIDFAESIYRLKAALGERIY
jgi:outer membrane protein TolC